MEMNYRLPLHTAICKLQVSKPIPDNLTVSNAVGWKYNKRAKHTKRKKKITFSTTQITTSTPLLPNNNNSKQISLSLAFSTYYNLKERNIDSFIAGGIAGINSWLLTYPVDTIKTRYQSHHDPSLKKIILQGNFSKGLGFCIFRAFIVNGVSFTLYEKL